MESKSQNWTKSNDHQRGKLKAEMNEVAAAAAEQ